MCGEAGEEILIKATVIREFQITEKRSRMKTDFFVQLFGFRPKYGIIGQKEKCIGRKGIL